MSNHDQKVLRLTLLLKKRTDLTDDEFQNYWTNIHGPLVKKWLQKHGPVRYCQYHLPSQYREKAQDIWGNLGRKSINDFDGHCQLYVPSLECFKNALADPYYKEVVMPDEDNFIDSSKCMRTLGWEECYIENGNLVEA